MTPYTLLVIEDDEALRRVLTRRLERMGYDVIACASGSDAVRVSGERAGAIDVLLSDMVMPGMTGTEAVRRIAETRPDMPIVFMSGYMQDDAMNAACAGPNHYFIEKPFESDALKAILDHALHPTTP